MPIQSWSGLLNWGTPWQSTQGTALTTATTATISPQAAGTKDFTLPANWWYPGAAVRVLGQGFLTTTTTSTTATIFLAAGATPTTLATPVGITTGTTAITGIQWWWETIIRCTGIGSSGNTLSTQGRLQLGNSGAGVPANPIALTATPGMTLPAPNISGETAAALDTTSAMAIMLRGTLAGANATIQCTQFLIESLD
jgi:hypothetical protein